MQALFLVLCLVVALTSVTAETQQLQAKGSPQSKGAPKGSPKGAPKGNPKGGPGPRMEVYTAAILINNYLVIYFVPT